MAGRLAVSRPRLARRKCRLYAAAVPKESPADGPRPGLDIEQLYRDHFRRVHAFALRMLGDKEAALDLAQESFARALAKADSFRGASAPLTWLLAITKNLCLRKLRGRRERTFAEFETIVDRCAEPPSLAHSEVERRFYAEQVKQGCLVGLLQCLPFAQRCVFVLHLLNELPIGTVARILGRSDNAVRILLSRSRTRMRAFLCANCSRLRDGNRCSCANMIEFSLERGLIERHRPQPAVPELAAELRRFSDEVEIYRSLAEPEVPIARLIASGRYPIFARK